MTFRFPSGQNSKSHRGIRVRVRLWHFGTCYHLFFNPGKLKWIKQTGGLSPYVGYMSAPS